jgi:anti-sigma-K factor RskA
MTSSPHSPRFDELLPAYALGALDGDELRELAAHLAAGCPACEAELRRLAAEVEDLAAAAADLPESLAAAAPEILGAVKRRLLAELPRQPRLRSVRAIGRWVPLAAAAVLALVAAWGLVRQARLGAEIERLRGESRQLAARAEAFERRAAQAQAESLRLARTISILAAPGVQSVSLAGMGTSHAAAGRTYVDVADRQAVFYASGLPALGPDKTYQLWYLDEQDHPTSAGVFEVDARGKAALVVDQPLPVERIQAWAVTIEPRGGRAQPTGPMALAG